MWVFVTGSLRQYEEQLTSLTGVASTPPSPPPHLLLTPTLTHSLPARESGVHVEKQNKAVAGVLAIYVLVCEYMSVCVFSSGKKASKNYLKQSVLRWNGERETGGERFSLSLQLCCCLGMQGRWEMQRREWSPPAKQWFHSGGTPVSQVHSITSKADTMQ